MGMTHKVVTVHNDLPPLLSLFRYITQGVVVIPFRRFGTTYRSCSRESRNRHTLRNIPEESRSHVLRGGSLKSVGLSFPRTWALVTGMYKLHLYVPYLLTYSMEQSP